MNKRKKRLILIAYIIVWSILLIVVINSYFSAAEHDWKTIDKEDIQTFIMIWLIGNVIFGILMGVVLMKFLDDLCKNSEENEINEPSEPY